MPETQLGLDDPPSSDPLDPGLGSDSEGVDADDDHNGIGGDTTRQGKKTPTVSTDKESGIKKAVRKVKAVAHANFRRLKLRNHGAKGGPGYNSRFRRR